MQRDLRHKTYHFCGRSSLEPSTSCYNFGPCDALNQDITKSFQRTWLYACQSNRGSANGAGIFQPSKHIRSSSGGGNPNDNVVLTQRWCQADEVSRAIWFGVFSAFDRVSNCMIAACNQPNELIQRC